MALAQGVAFSAGTQAEYMDLKYGTTTMVRRELSTVLLAMVQSAATG
jgi:hypothetical protein